MRCCWAHPGPAPRSKAAPGARLGPPGARSTSACARARQPHLRHEAEVGSYVATVVSNAKGERASVHVLRHCMRHRSASCRSRACVTTSLRAESRLTCCRPLLELTIPCMYPFHILILTFHHVSRATVCNSTS